MRIDLCVDSAKPRGTELRPFFSRIERYERSLEWDGAIGRCRGGSCLRQSGGGFAALALAGLLAEESRAASPDPRHPLASRPPHFPAGRSGSSSCSCMAGPSQVDTFDYKPLLDRDHGKPLPFAKPRVVSGKTGNLLRSPFKFQRYGQSGIAVSELFPCLAAHVDDLCMINSMHGSNSRHGGALARASHRQRYVYTPEHGFVDHLRPGDREPGPSGFHHGLPEPEPRRREQLELGVLAGRLPGNADRQYGHPVRPGQDSVHRQRVDLAPLQRLELDLIQEMNRDCLEAGPRGSGAGGPHRLVRAGLPHAGGRARSAGHLGRNRRDASSSTDSTTRRRETLAASA